MECIELDKFFFYLKNLVDDRERARIEAHLATGCQACHKSLKWSELVLRTALEDQSYDFPEEVIANIVAMFKERMAANRQPIRRYIAELIFDSGLLPQLAVARLNSNEAAGRRVLYHVEGYHIDLSFVLSKENNDERLTGQIIPEQQDAAELTPFKVELLQQGSVVSSTHTNARGIFEFAQLVSGTYDLKLSLPDGEINIERVPTARAL